jgi:Putative transposase
MTLDAVEFLRRFLLHVLPKGFMRIRYYGFLSNRDRSQKLLRVRALLGQPAPSTPTVTEPPGLAPLDSSDQPPFPQAVAPCPVCNKGRLLLVAQVGIVVVVVVPVHYLLDTACLDSS